MKVYWGDEPLVLDVQPRQEALWHGVGRSHGIGDFAVHRLYVVVHVGKVLKRLKLEGVASDVVQRPFDALCKPQGLLYPKSPSNVG